MCSSYFVKNAILLQNTYSVYVLNADVAMLEPRSRYEEAWWTFSKHCCKYHCFTELTLTIGALKSHLFPLVTVLKLSIMRRTGIPLLTAGLSRSPTSHGRLVQEKRNDVCVKIHRRLTPWIYECVYFLQSAEHSDIYCTSLAPVMPESEISWSSSVWTRTLS